VLTYNAKLESDPESLKALREMLVWHRVAFNYASDIQFRQEKNSIVELHAKFYGKFRAEHPHIPSQVVIRGEQECLSAYRSIRSNKHAKTKPAVKKNLSMRLDKRLYSLKKEKIRVTTALGRREFGVKAYGKISELMGKFPFQDPLVFERGGELFVALTFKTEPSELPKQKLALGVDLGMRIPAACSDGRLIVDKRYNERKRKLRFLKRQLQSSGSKSASKHLKKVRRKERNMAKNQCHLLANEILKTDADTVVLEDLTKVKAKRHPAQNKNAVSQVPFYELKRIISYKASNMGKHVVTVNPAYTSQDDSVTGKRDGVRKGRRYYSRNGLVYDSDLNAARNIAKKAKLPLSQGNLLDGAGRVVTLPNACQPRLASLASLRL
jgi:IS605 OrfB family transposase